MLPPETDALAPFARLRPRLLRIAYRMLGSVAEAEDVVQEAYIRWHEADRSAVRAPEGFLVRIVTRLCLDILKSARVQRERYVGSWLPEPLLDGAEEQRDDVTFMLMLALERLSPLLYHGTINGMPGFVTLEPQNVLQSTAFDIESGRIVAVYIVRNPDKLRHMRVLLDP